MRSKKCLNFTGVIGYVRAQCTFYLGTASKRFTLQ